MTCCFERPVISVQPLIQHHCDPESSLPPQCALPDDRHSPPGFEQIMPVAPVTAHVFLKLGLPEFLASCRGRGVWTPVVTVPEAAMNETHGSESTEHEIGSAREFAVVQSVPQAACVESLAESNFGYSISASDSCHHERACRLVHYVRHLSDLTDSEECLYGRISRETLGMIKCGHVSRPRLGGISGIDSGRGGQDRQQRTRGSDSRPEYAVRALTIDGEHCFRPQSYFGGKR